MRLLLEEFTHRVGGEFAAAIRILSTAVALAQTDEAKSILAAVQHRLENFARVHAALGIPERRTSIDGRTYLRHLCESLSVSRLKWQGVHLELVERTLEIDSEQCWRLGMIVSELVADAATHSFVSVPARIWVAAARRGALIWCRVEHNGMPSENESESRGMRIVGALARELHGELERYHQRDVCVAAVMFPATCAADLGFPTSRYLR
jgi:two-component sensor histidine kinase